MDPLEKTQHLIARYQDGADQEALAELMERYQPRLERIVSVRIPVQHLARFDKEDVIQDALLRAIGGLPTFKFTEEASFIKYLSKIVKNEFLNKIKFHERKKRDVRTTVQIDPGPDEASTPRAVHEPVAKSGSPRTKAIRREFGEQVDFLMQRLEERNPRWHMAIMHRHYYGGSVAWVGEQLGVTEDAAAKLIRRGKDALEILAAEAGLAGS